MTQEEYENELQNLLKENRILRKKLERSECDRTRSEENKQNQESLLKQVICELQDSQAVLEKKSSALEKAFNKLTVTQTRLVEAEKMSALGRLVAGVAHEINTPVGTSITLASMIADETKILVNTIAQEQLKRSTLNIYLEVVQESATLLVSNLNRAGELIQSFKQVAVDQTSLECRTFEIKKYLEEVIISLSPHIKKTSHTISLKGPNNLIIKSYPGALAQIATNLVTNSLVHGLRPNTTGKLCFDLIKKDEQIVIHYRDNGSGIAPENLSKIFDPFFTTAQHQGGTGLGLHIVYNLVTQKLKGKIRVESALGQGVLFEIIFPASSCSNDSII